MHSSRSHFDPLSVCFLFAFELTFEALLAFALVVAGQILANAIRPAGARAAALVDILASELRVARIVGGTLAKVAAWRVDTLGACSADGDWGAASRASRALVNVQTCVQVRRVISAGPSAVAVDAQ